MRIIGGTKRGARLETPSGRSTRPMPDRVRQSLFDILGQDMTGRRFLDLFCGTGAVGLEAASRGAVRCVLVDSGREAVQVCGRNIARLAMAGRVSLMPVDAARAVEELAARGGTFDVVFAGPPFRLDVEAVRTLVERVAVSPLLAEGGLVVVQLKSDVGSFAPAELTLVDDRIYGINRLFFFRKNL
jgi:16S rRNA (guanine966-N2)-methyltransferase